MLKTNSKKARENMAAFILEWCADEIEEANVWNAEQGDPKRYDPASVESACNFILDDFVRRHGYEIGRRRTAVIFQEYAQGLPLNIFDFWYYKRDAKNEVAAILEETDAERDRFTESQAGEFLTTLIFNECIRRTGRAIF